MARPLVATHDSAERASGAVLRRAAPALLAYAGTRLLGLAVLAIWAAVAGESPHRLLSARWDSLWYARIAADGYGYSVSVPAGADVRVHSDLAFFPLLPWLERLLAEISPLSHADAGLLVSALASLVAAWGIFAVGDLLYGRRAGTTLVVLWAALPVGIVQSMAYSESLFTALAAWGVYAVLCGRWVTAGVLAALAGLTRPVGAAVVAAVWLTAAATLLPGRRGPRDRAERRRMLLGLALAPLGWCGYVVWVGIHTESVTGYLDVQGGWGNGFDGGLAFAGFIGEQLTGPTFLGGAALLVGVALLLWLYVACVRQRQPLPLLVYGGVVLLLALSAKGYFGSKPRLLLPAFPLLLPIALALARLRPVRAGLLLGALGLVSALYGAFWLHGSGPP
ncbi:glycosyltransferase family 39 protein [Streptomyces sp. LX-29]|uniref:glycosyltransferase family 39 protein n=1 Tax=Streptomyces sp. LX-29 TaxID=2900152 RepID=UPI00240D55DD|nr:glycosyltransferase family 39 protein [Streptomyces sp. LX-29]WFB11873.1 glycosyltransferase family 39 protein [Streptomyces sp. LX-29]